MTERPVSSSVLIELIALANVVLTAPHDARAVAGEIAAVGVDLTEVHPRRSSAPLMLWHAIASVAFERLSTLEVDRFCKVAIQMRDQVRDELNVIIKRELAA